VQGKLCGRLNFAALHQPIFSAGLFFSLFAVGQEAQQIQLD
jgi:hypothetical protein